MSENTTNNVMHGTYCIKMTVPEDDTTFRELEYRFRRPAVASYDRYVKTASQVGITQASKTFLLDAVIEPDREKLTKDMEEFPGVAITIGNKLTEILGLIGNVNLTKL